MNVKDLIELLQKAEPEAIVLTYDGDTDCMEEITGMIFGGDGKVVELQTDEIDG